MSDQNLSADQLLIKFLEDNNIVLQFAPIQTRQLQDGALLIEKPILTASFKTTSSLQVEDKKA